MVRKIAAFMHRHYDAENLVYVIVWIAVCVVQLIISTMGLREGEDVATRVVNDALALLPFFLLFLVNNLWLEPRMFRRKSMKLYIALSLTLAMLITIISLLLDTPMTPGDLPPDLQRQGFEHANRFAAGNRMTHLPGPVGPMESIWQFIQRPVMSRFILAIAVLSANVATKQFFRSVHDRERLKQLEYQNLQTELTMLRYQINPHFFMNTLNNIHALVDVDQEQAKETIVELSHLMRYLLYDTNRLDAPLDKEIDFMRNYVKIMQIRYPDTVKVALDFPEQPGNITMPPLLFISFIENAFKHGISYRRPSFIDISISIQGDELQFRCVNSNAGHNNDKHHGIGLANINKRLQLLYADRYTLSIAPTDDTFSVNLQIPIRRT